MADPKSGARPLAEWLLKVKTRALKRGTKHPSSQGTGQLQQSKLEQIDFSQFLYKNGTFPDFDGL